MKIARLENNIIKEVKIVSEEIIRSSEANNGNGWYNVILFDNTTLTKYEQLQITETYNLTTDIVEEIPTITEISLEDYKIQKYSELANNTLNYVYSICPQYKQSTALDKKMFPENISNPYTLEEANKILDFCNEHTTEVRRIKPLILSATTKEEIDLQPSIAEFFWVD